jgi:predicted Zn-dependent protease with MMP-like domain
VDEARFEELVAEALDSLPEEFLARLDNVEVVIDESPSAEDMAEADMEGEDPDSLLGLYIGIPLTERGGFYAGVLPDRISLFRRSIVTAAGGDPETIKEEVRHTVVHEIAHFYGLSEERIDELGWG